MTKSKPTSFTAFIPNWVRILLRVADIAAAICLIVGLILSLPNVIIYGAILGVGGIVARFHIIWDIILVLDSALGQSMMSRTVAETNDVD